MGAYGYTGHWDMGFKDSLADAEVLEWWRWAVDEGILLLEDSGTPNSMKILRRSSS